MALVAPQPPEPTATQAEPEAGLPLAQALRLERNVAFFAGAGAGKTHSLVTLALHVLGGAREGLDAVTCSGLVLATFTDKAAGEMRERLRARLVRLADGVVEEPDLVASYARLGKALPGVDFWRRCVDELGSASITTFHSFCSALLKRAPPSAGLDPSFVLLEEREAKALALSVVQRGLVDAVAAGDELLGELVRELTLGDEVWPGLSGALAQAVTRIREEGLDPRTTAITDGAAARSAFERRLLELRQASALARRELRTGTQVERLAEFDALIGRLGFAELRDAWPSLKVLAQRFGANAVLKPLRQLLDGGDDSVLALYGAALVAPYEAKLRDFVGQLVADLEAELKRRRALDFTGLLVATRALLRDHLETRRAVQRRLGALLVDEFQDTNRLQLDIVLLIAEQRAGGPRPVSTSFDGGLEESLALPLEPGFLAVVGDRKQAIYEFRGADVAVFELMAKAIERHGGARAFLSQSRRSSAPLVRAVNSLMPQVLTAPSDALPFEIAWAPEDALRAVRTDGLARAPVLQLVDARAAELSAPVEFDADAVARWVALALRSGEPLVVDAGGPRGARGGDVALLFQRLSSLEQYRQALLRHGVRHRVVRGRGFFGAQEVLDVAALLSLVARPEDSLSLAAVLRGPFVCVTDASLLKLATVGERIVGLDLTGTRLRGSTLPEDDAARVRAFLTGMDTLWRERHVLGARSLLLLADELLGLRRALAASPHGEQALANVDKLLELARVREAAGVSFAEFARELAALVTLEPPEGQAELGEDAADDVVTLCTVHQAKGLEWPIVVLPELFARPPPDGATLLFDRDLGLALRPLAFEDGTSQRRARLLERRKRRVAAERRRLLYVAATRARDLLVLGLHGKPGDGRWDSWLAQSTNPAGQADVEVVDAQALPAGVLPPVPPEPPDADLLVARALDHVQARPTPTSPDVMVAVTPLEDFLGCPRRYHYLHDVGLDEPRSEPSLPPALWPQAEQVRVEGVDVRARGTAAHRLLELLPVDLPAERLDATLQALERAEQLGSDLDVRRWVARFWQGAYGRGLAHARTVLRELPFVLRIGPGDGVALHLRGQIDLVVAHEGGVDVVDYKTAAPSPDGAAAHAFQLRCYRLAVRRLFGAALPCRAGVVFLKAEQPEPVWLSHADDDAALSVELLAQARALRDAQALSRWDGRARERCHALGCGFVGHCHPSPV